MPAPNDRSKQYKEVLLNGLPLSEVQRLEKRGQIVNYPGQSWIGSPPVSEKAGEKLAQQTRFQAFRIPGPLRLKWRDMQDFRSPVETSDGLPLWSKNVRVDNVVLQLWQNYRSAIDRRLANMDWFRGTSLNIGIILLLGLGVWVPVKLFFFVLSLPFRAFGAGAEGITSLGTTVAFGAVAYFALRKLMGRLTSE